ncbi:MAG: MBL fold metallo-hydrolase [Candidatus Gracilibacteria bacterium]|nr:MBL fold metallo-hydrolase [Candidatus Gracilibacteria bacterium]
MKIDYLGHSEFLINIENNKGENVRILSDCWLSNYVFGDLMARNPTFKIDYSKFGDLDAIFISHSHSDHFDPYTLVEFYNNLSKLPLLLIPETMEFLVGLLEKYLPKFDYKILRNKQEIDINGVKIKGLVFENDYVTNEDDVMTLFVYNDREIIYAEVDTLPPETIEAQNYMYSMFTSKKFETAFYLATRNELEGNIKLLDISDVAERKKFISEYVNKRKENTERDFFKFDNEEVEFKDISRVKNYCKSLIGQGIVYSKILDENALKVKVLGLDELVQIEKSLMKNYHRNYDLSYFEAGYSYEIKNAKIIKLSKLEYLKDFSFVRFPVNISEQFNRYYSNGPLNKQNAVILDQEKVILDLLNNRFLSYQIVNLEDPLKNVLLQNKRDYVIKINYLENGEYIDKYYSYGFSKFNFTEIINPNYFDEDYFANDVVDFYEGKQELYSNFWHKLTPGKGYRFWTMLGSNFLNNDLVYKKYELHFKLALEGKKVDEYVENIYKSFNH